MKVQQCQTFQYFVSNFLFTIQPCWNLVQRCQGPGCDMSSYSNGAWAGKASTFHVHKTFERAKLKAGKPKISFQKFVQGALNYYVVTKCPKCRPPSPFLFALVFRFWQPPLPLECSNLNLNKKCQNDTSSKTQNKSSKIYGNS